MTNDTRRVGDEPTSRRDNQPTMVRPLGGRTMEAMVGRHTTSGSDALIFRGCRIRGLLDFLHGGIRTRYLR